MSYGVPYLGSKNIIADDLITMLPSCKVFVDIFGGGASMMHKAILSNKYKQFIYNDLSKDIYLTIKLLKNNAFTGIDHFVDRKEFHSSKDVFIKTIFSFKNNREDYFCSKEKEKYQKLICDCYMLNDWKEAISKYGDTYKQKIKQLKDLYRFCLDTYVNRIFNFQKDLQNVNIELFNTSYEKIKIPKNSLIYCDPPYLGTRTTGYTKNKFDYDKFYEWASTKKNIYISEYVMPNDFVPIVACNRRSQIHDNLKVVTEKLFVPKSNYDEAMSKYGLFI